MYNNHINNYAFKKIHYYILIKLNKLYIPKYKLRRILLEYKNLWDDIVSSGDGKEAVI